LKVEVSADRGRTGASKLGRLKKINARQGRSRMREMKKHQEKAKVLCPLPKTLKEFGTSRSTSNTSTKEQRGSEHKTLATKVPKQLGPERKTVG